MAGAIIRGRPAQIDLLITIKWERTSAFGMDTKVIGRAHGMAPGEGPDIRPIFARNLTAESTGNAVGVGKADIIHERLYRKIDLEKTYINAITSLSPESGRLPMHLPSDRAALDFALGHLGSPDPCAQRCVWIRNTLSLTASPFRLACATRSFVPRTGAWRRLPSPPSSTPRGISIRRSSAGDLFWRIIQPIKLDARSSWSLKAHPHAE